MANTLTAKFSVETDEDSLVCSHVIDEKFTPNRDLWKSWEVINTEDGTTVIDIKIHSQRSGMYCRMWIQNSSIELHTVTKGNSAAEALCKACANLKVEFNSPFVENTFDTKEIFNAVVRPICYALNEHNTVVSVVENF